MAARLRQPRLARGDEENGFVREAATRTATAVRHALGAWVDAAVVACLAPRCAVCASFLSSPASGAVCEPCWQSVRCFTPPLCGTCGAPLAQAGRSAVSACALCAHAPLRNVDRARVLGLYDGTLREVVHALKFGRRHGIARRLAARLAETHGDLLDDMDALVPVPLHPRRRRERGFNQSHEVARQLARPVLPALRRARDTSPQTALDARARLRNVECAFSLAWRVRTGAALRRATGRKAEAPGGPLDGLRLVLVDDVWTTGATLSACARVLKAAGAREVAALVIARAVPSRLR